VTRQILAVLRTYSLSGIYPGFRCYGRCLGNRAETETVCLLVRELTRLNGKLVIFCSVD